MSKLVRSCRVLAVQHHQVLGDLVAHVEVDDPVHQVEAGERHREEDPGVLVNVRRADPHHFLQVLPALDLLGGLAVWTPGRGTPASQGHAPVGPAPRHARGRHVRPLEVGVQPALGQQRHG